MLVPPWRIAIFEISLVPGNRVLVRGNLVASQIDKAGGYDFKEVYRSVGEQRKEVRGRLTLEHIVRYQVSTRIEVTPGNSQ